jgi:hypothetical protein
MTSHCPLVPMLLAAATLASLGGCTRDDAGARIPTAVEATAPLTSAASAPAALANAAAAINPLDAKDEIGQAMSSFLGLKSYHIDMDTSTAKSGMAMDVDFVAPDRYRMKTPMGTQYVIGDTMYITMNGRTMKVPLPKGQLTNYRDPVRLEEHRATMTVRLLGSEAIDGQMAKKYLVSNTHPQPSESTMWVGVDGYPLKIEVTGDTNGQVARTSMRYSRFNDPTIRVDPPQ